MAVDIGITIKPIPVRNNVIELDVVAKLTNVSIDFNNVVKILIFLFLFGFIIFVFELGNHFINVNKWVIETVHITQTFF